MILITGSGGQIGKLFIDKLLMSKNNFLLVDRIYNSEINLPKNFKRLTGDLQDIKFVKSIFKNFKIENIINLATNSFVERSVISSNPIFDRCNIFDNIIDAISIENRYRNIWMFHPLSSEVFGIPNEYPQTSKTKISPINAYGLQKSTELTKCNFLINNGYKIFYPILYNQESKYRSNRFFSKKIIYNLKKIKGGDKNLIIDFYNSESIRDFGYANDYVEIFIQAMKNKFVGMELIGSGESIKIIDFIIMALNFLKMEFRLSNNSEGLIRILYEDRIIMNEVDRDINDTKRKFKAKLSSEFIEKYGVQIRGGKQLIKLLSNEIN